MPYWNVRSAGLGCLEEAARIAASMIEIEEGFTGKFVIVENLQ